MGWYYGYNTRAELIAEITKESDKVKTIAHSTRSNVLWTVHELKQDGEYNKAGHRFIGCYLLSNRGDHGYKPMDEGAGPYVYSCPLSYLDLAPVANQEWRDEVRKYHAQQTRTFAVGQVVKFKDGVKPSQLTITSLKPFRGESVRSRVQAQWSHPPPGKLRNRPHNTRWHAVRGLSRNHV